MTIHYPAEIRSASQAGGGADAQLLTWASCCPASVDTCRSSSQSILFPKRRIATSSRLCILLRTCSLSHTCLGHLWGQALVDLTLPSRKSWPCLLHSYTHSPLSISHPLQLYFHTSACFPSGKPAPPLSLWACHPLSRANLKSPPLGKPSWIAPAQSCRFLPVLNSLALDYTGCLDSSPNCLMGG